MKQLLSFIKYKFSNLKLEYKFWLLKKAFDENPEFEKEFKREKFHESLMISVLNHLETTKYDESTNWLAGTIPEDWENRLNSITPEDWENRINKILETKKGKENDLLG